MLLWTTQTAIIDCILQPRGCRSTSFDNEKNSHGVLACWIIYEQNNWCGMFVTRPLVHFIITQ
jgi:hypothetical protein